MQQAISRVAVETRAISVALLVLVFSIAILASLVWFAGLEFTDTGAFGSTVSTSLALVITMSFVGGYLWQKPKNTSRLRRFNFYVNMTFLSISHGAVAFLLGMAATSIASHYTPTITMNPLFMSSIIAFVLSAGAYAMYSHAAFMSASRLAGLYVVFIAAGALASMLTSQNTTWLQHHFSALGAGDTVSSYAFNLTMIVGGFLMVALSDYLVMDIEQIKRNRQLHKKIRMNFLRVVFVVVGVCSIGIGIFPYDKFLLVHNIFANAMTISFIALVVSIPWTVPMFSRPFIVQSYVVVAIAAAVYAQFFVGDLNILVIELIDAALLFMWMILFVRQIAAFRLDQPALPVS